MSDGQRPDTNYDNQKKVFFVRVGDIMFGVPSPYQKLANHPASSLAGDGAFQHVIAQSLQTSEQIDGNAMLRQNPALLAQVKNAIGECMHYYVQGKVGNVNLNDGSPATIRCISFAPPAFEFLAADLTAKISFYEVAQIRVETAARTSVTDDPMPLAKAIVGANGRRLFEACARLWINELGLPPESIIAR